MPQSEIHIRYEENSYHIIFTEWFRATCFVADGAGEPAAENGQREADRANNAATGQITVWVLLWVREEQKQGGLKTIAVLPSL